MVYNKLIDDSSIKPAKVSKGKLPRQYINYKNTNTFYIVKDTGVYEVYLEVENDAIKTITLYNDTDNKIRHLKQGEVTLIVTRFGVVTMSISKSIIYFSKPDDVLIYV